MPMEPGDDGSRVQPGSGSWVMLPDLCCEIGVFTVKTKQTLLKPKLFLEIN